MTGLVEVSVSGIGSGAMTAVVNASRAGTGHTGAVSGPQGLSSGLQFNLKSTSAFDVGDAASGGRRYVSLTFLVRNAPHCAAGNCLAYQVARKNVTLHAVKTSGSLATIGNSAFRALNKVDGTPIDNAVAFVQQIVPAHGMTIGGDAAEPGQDSLVVFRESELPAPTDPSTTYLLPYGFVVNHVAGTSRTLPANPAPDWFDGLVTLAFSMPILSSATANPSSFNVFFELSEDDNTRVVQSLEERNAAGDAAVLQRADVLQSSDIVTLGCDRVPTAFQAETLCKVRLTGPAAAPESYLVDTPETGCSAATAPGPVQTSIVTPGAPVDVPAHFMGMHRGLHVPAHLADAYAAVPAPAYPYGFVRNLKAEVDGAYESGFWSNIELSPGIYTWTRIDKWVQDAAGHPIIWLIYGTPAFYQKYPNEASMWPSWPGIASPPTNEGHAALVDFTRAVKARYGSQIVAFELWNEPTFPWTKGETSYSDRWSPAWASANGAGPPFFSGSASDLANIAYTLNNADLGVPILGGGFVNAWAPESNSLSRFLDAPVTLPGGSGTGKNHIQAVSSHFYDYDFTPETILEQMLGYRSKLDAAGLKGMPIWNTETGAEADGRFFAGDLRAPVNVQRWVLLGAASGLRSLVLYGHFAGDEAIKYLGDPVGNASLIASLTEASAIGGQTICHAAVLNDGRVWINTRQGQAFVR